jgi:broad specificity phosphatase PhoE
MTLLSRWTVLVVGLGLGVVLGMALQSWLAGGDRPVPVVEAKPARAGQGGNASASSAREPPADARAVMDKLRQGGLILFIRHATRTKVDSVSAFDVLELSRRPQDPPVFPAAVGLNDVGREEAVLLGRLLEMASIPVGAVISSPSCRARETARLAFGRLDRVDHGLVYDRVQNPDNQADFKAALGALLANAPLEQGRNTVLVGHGDTLPKNTDLFASGVELAGKDKPVEEGGFYVIRRDAEGKLHIVHRFLTLGDFARHAVTLNVPGSKG